MSILGYYFRYDNKASKQYNLMIASIKTNTDNTTIDGEKEYTTLFLPCNNRFVLQGVKPKEPLSFDIEFVCDNSNQAITDLQSRNIIKWLFDRQSYHKFEIFNKDYAGVYFNCYFTKPEVIQAGVGIIGYKCTVICDSPWAWETDKQTVYNITSTPCFQNYICNSDYEDYLIPNNVQITCGTTGGTVSITNIQDNNRIFQFTGLSPNEVISVDNFGQITSSTGNKRFSNWNGKILRFVNGVNTLNITGNITKLVIDYNNPRRVVH